MAAPIIEIGPLTDSNGNVVGEIRWGQTDPNTCDAPYEVVLPEAFDVVLEGSEGALNIETVRHSADHYTIKKTRRGYKPTTVIDQEDVWLQKFGTIREFITWMDSVSYDTLEAYRQIYFDQWNFEDDTFQNRTYYDLLEEEVERRKKLGLFAAGIKAPVTPADLKQSIAVNTIRDGTAQITLEELLKVTENFTPATAPPVEERKLSNFFDDDIPF